MHHQTLLQETKLCCMKTQKPNTLQLQKKYTLPKVISPPPHPPGIQQWNLMLGRNLESHKTTDTRKEEPEKYIASLLSQKFNNELRHKKMEA